MLEPADIDQKQFKTTRLKEGYDQIEVDTFLDRVVSDYSQVRRELAAAEREVERLKRVVANQSQTASEAVTSVLPVTPVDGAQRILVAAQKTADQVEADANIEAGKIRAAARAEADSVKSAAEAERQRILNQLESERSDLVEKIEILRAKRSGYKTWLKSSLAKIEEEESNV